MSDVRAGLVHEVLLTDDDAELLEVASGFARDGLDHDEALLLACAPDHSAALLDGLGVDAGRSGVAVLDHRLMPPRAPAALDQQLGLLRRALRGGAPRVRVVGEPPVNGGSGGNGSWREWARFEAAANHVLAELPVWSLCVYDVRTTSSTMLNAVRATHPRLSGVGPGAARANPDYVAPAEYLASIGDPALLPIEGSRPLLAVGSISTLARVRDVRDGIHHALAERAHGFPSHRGSAMGWLSIEDFVLAAHEVLANAVLHGRRPVRAQLWVESDQAVCTVTDRGGGFDDPFVGYQRGTDGDDGNGNDLPARMGLWLARQLSDDLSVRRDAHGFTVRLRAQLCR